MTRPYPDRVPRVASAGSSDAEPPWAGIEKNPCLRVCGVRWGPAYMIPSINQLIVLV